MNIENFLSSVFTNITSKTEKKSITPLLVGGALRDLAVLTKSTIENIEVGGDFAPISGSTNYIQSVSSSGNTQNANIKISGAIFIADDQIVLYSDGTANFKGIVSGLAGVNSDDFIIKSQLDELGLIVSDNSETIVNLVPQDRTITINGETQALSNDVEFIFTGSTTVVPSNLYKRISSSSNESQFIYPELIGKQVYDITRSGLPIEILYSQSDQLLQDQVHFNRSTGSLKFGQSFTTQSELIRILYYLPVSNEIGNYVVSGYVDNGYSE